MPKHKVSRKGTSVDMTAMCDVAFLLLSFFILTTKFKPSEVLTVVTPNSVSTKVAPENDVALITIDKDGKVYLSISDKNVSEKREIIDIVATSKNLTLSPAQKSAFARAGYYVGVPFSKLPALLGTPAESIKNIKMEGIPVTDTLNNELQIWMGAVKSAFEGKKLEILVKGDNASKYPSFQGVINAFKKNDLMKFQMITNPEAVPMGSELSKRPRTATPQ
ncbi:MAG: biopolymer transporter ExbD [Gemmatimonadaceae bacterium]|nr:biopolymer transporter ExbD [Chitinophagaceae bacterium]